MPLVLDRQIQMTWVPPLGIPAPPLGITEVTPSPPSPWTGALTGYYYVDNTSGAATDTSNPNGWPAQPRLTIPTSFAAGDICFVHGGPYIYNTAGPDAFQANGTAEAPVWVIGVADETGTKPACKAPAPNQDRYLQVRGSYCFIEGFRFADGTSCGLAIIGSYLVIRRNEFVNFQPTPGDGGRKYGAVLSSGYATYGGQLKRGGGDHYVIYDNVFRDNGEYLSLVDQKVQGIKFTGEPGVPGTAYVWILNNLFYHNGQGMQHGDDCVGTMVDGACQAELSAFPHHFYIGYNTMHEDREVGIALKMIRDVIISQNDIYNYHDIPPDSNCATFSFVTALNIGRDASDNVWVLFNRVHETVSAVRSNGQDEATTGPTPVYPKVYVIGNLIFNTVGERDDGTGSYCVPWSPTNPNSTGAAVVGWTNYQLFVVDNTIINADKGVSVTSNGYYEITGNLFLNCGDPMALIPTSWGINLFDYNFYAGTARLAYNDATPLISLSAMQDYAQEEHSLEGDPALEANYQPAVGSPLIGANVRSGVYDVFESLYGLDIAKDYTGRPRPSGAWSIGAYEPG